MGGEDGAAWTVARLPHELLSVVFSKLDVADRARSSRVCRQWREAAVQAPHSTDLELRVLVADGREPWPWPVHPRALRPEKAAALLRGPLCSSLQRLSLGFVVCISSPEVFIDPASCAWAPWQHGCSFVLKLPVRCQDVCMHAVSESALLRSSIGLVAAALPHSLVSLSIAGLSKECPDEWAVVLAHLDLQNTAPRLEELDLRGREDPDGFACVDLERDDRLLISPRYLNLSHPSLKRLGIDVPVDEDADSELALALQRLPRLEGVSSIRVDEISQPSGSILVTLADHGVRTKWLYVEASTFGEVYTRLVKPGAALDLFRCVMPVDGGWNLPAGITELRLEQCSLDPALFERLLCRTGSVAPGLERLVITGSCLGQLHPPDVVAALRQVPGGTQIEIHCPEGSGWQTADLARTLAASPVLHRFVHLGPFVDARALPPAVADDYAAYYRARTTALRGMGEIGKRLLADQGYEDRYPSTS